MNKWFCFFKAYGDFVIACSFLRERLESHYGLICGSHLQQLAEAINFSQIIKWVDVSDYAVPALFDVKKCGIYEAICSAWKIRKAVRREVSRKDSLVFDRISLREKIISWPLRIENITMGEPNIYLDYAKYFNSAFHMAENQMRKKFKSVSIFPDARLAGKILNDKLIGLIFDECVKKGISAKVVRVAPQEACLSNLSQKNEYIYGFGALVKSLTSCDAVISTDSLPAHLAEYFNIPVFVLTPQRNDYWMPFTVFKNRTFALFDNLDPLRAWLD